MYHVIFSTHFGWCGIVKTDRGICSIVLPQRSKQSVEQQIREEFPESVSAPKRFSAETALFQDYFTGEAQEVPFPLDLQGATSFQQQVWMEAGKIPYGEVRTYGWIAARLGKPGAGRAVGNALGRNPVPLAVPCHRVVRENGGLGGFSGEGGVKMKQRLLELEGADYKGVGSLHNRK